MRANHDQIVEWVGKDSTVVKIGDLLARRGMIVPQRTLHRYCTQHTDYRGRGSVGTVPVADGEPGVECQIDFGRMGKIFDPESGRNRVVHALIFTAVYWRHMFVWLTFNQTLEVIIAGCEAAWRFFDGVFRVLIPDYVARHIIGADPGRHRAEMLEGKHVSFQERFLGLGGKRLTWNALPECDRRITNIHTLINTPAMVA